MNFKEVKMPTLITTMCPKCGEWINYELPQGISIICHETEDYCPNCRKEE